MPAPAARNRVSGTTPDALSVLNSVFGLPGFRGEQEKIVRHVTDGGMLKADADRRRQIVVPPDAIPAEIGLRHRHA